MRKIYVVSGSTGEYSDRREWNVAAYFSEARAARRVVELDRVAKEIYQRTRGPAPDLDAWSDEYKQAIATSGDPDMQIDYTGTNYYLAAIDIVDDEAQP